MTGPEIRVARASAGKDNMGLVSWKGRDIRKSDTQIAKNYLGDAEVRDLNRFTNMLLDYFEQETDLRRLVSMADTENAVDRFIRNNERAALLNAGSISKAQADAHCDAEYDKFNDLRKQRYLQDPEE
jgi:hypothetical protein